MTESKLRDFQKIAKNLLDDDQFEEAHDLVQQAVRILDGGFDSLVRKAQLVGQSIHADEMRGDATFWQKLAQEWGRGSGYRDRINRHNQEWFMEGHQGAADRRVIKLVQEEWVAAVSSVRELLTQE